MLVNMKDLLDDAKINKYAIGAFNTPTFEAIMAVVKAAEETKRPVIIQHAQVHDKNINKLEIIGPIMLDLAHKAKIPVAVHIDHGEDFDFCLKGLKLGFTSVMYDASSKSLEENIKETKYIVDIAKYYNASVEAELGTMLASSIGSEGKVIDTDDLDLENEVYTNPNQAQIFVQATNVDALAISFGTVHGVYIKKPELNLNRILEIKEKVDIPFVMHGGSGVSEEDIKIAIANGITKINYYTYMALKGGQSVNSYLKTKTDNNIFSHDLSQIMIDAMKEDVKNAIKIFSNL